MKVKIGSEWIDSDDQPLAVEFEEDELEFVKSKMNKQNAPNNRFAVGSWPDQTKAKEWVRECDE